MSVAPNPCTMHPLYWAAWIDGFAAGHFAGYELHRAEIDAADQAMFAETSRRVRQSANSPRFSTLCDRRGEPHRAARARMHERRIGLPVAP